VQPSVMIASNTRWHEQSIPRQSIKAGSWNH